MGGTSFYPALAAQREGAHVNSLDTAVKAAGSAVSRPVFVSDVRDMGLWSGDGFVSLKRVPATSFNARLGTKDSNTLQFSFLSRDAVVVNALNVLGFPNKVVSTKFRAGARVGIFALNGTAIVASRTFTVKVADDINTALDVQNKPITEVRVVLDPPSSSQGSQTSAVGSASRFADVFPEMSETEIDAVNVVLFRA